MLPLPFSQHLGFLQQTALFMQLHLVFGMGSSNWEHPSKTPGTFCKGTTAQNLGSLYVHITKARMIFWNHFVFITIKNV